MRGLRVAYGANEVLKGIDLSIAPGSFVALLGASGCGKTTLLNVMAGFLPPTSGNVLFRGEEITGPAADRGVVFQNDALFPWLTVRGNVEFSLRLKQWPKWQRRSRVDSLLSMVGLAKVAEQPIWSLSGGMQQRVGLARALANDPEVLLMDEPLGALDAITRQSMQTLILDLWGRTHKGIFLITHEIEEAVFMASRLIIMSPGPGRIVASRDLDFSRRYLAGEPARSIKSDPVFVATREEVLSLILESLTGDGSTPDAGDTATTHFTRH
ncbi:MAG: ATP-binding cassette domain-containing protein [Dongiaceae bacterium]